MRMKTARGGSEKSEWEVIIEVDILRLGCE